MRKYTYQKQRQTQERRSHNRFDGWLRHQSSEPSHMRFSEKPRSNKEVVNERGPITCCIRIKRFIQSIHSFVNYSKFQLVML